MTQANRRTERSAEGWAGTTQNVANDAAQKVSEDAAYVQDKFGAMDEAHQGVVGGCEVTDARQAADGSGPHDRCGLRPWEVPAEVSVSVLRLMLVLAAATVLVGCAQPIPARMVYAPTIVDGCQNLGRASDTQYMRLANKAGELGGTHALILREVPRQHAWGVEEYVAEVYRCGTTVSQR